MSKKKGRPEWFRLYGNLSPLFDSLSREAVGDAVVYGLRYFEHGEEPPDNLNPIARIGFNMLKNEADKAFSDYDLAVENGNKGPAAKAAKQGVTHPPPG